MLSDAGGSPPAHIMEPLLTMRGIDKRFGGVPALVDARFALAPGEVHALIGQNGAGKSTLIKVLTGAYQADAGEVLFEGRPFHAASPQAAQRAGISTIYQEINLVGARSVTENIFLGRERTRLGLLNWRAMHDGARALLDRFGVRVDVRQPLERLPTATRQMVAIARAIGFQARVVIMDEPTSSLSDREVEVLFGVIRQLRAEGVSVVFVSHKLDELYAVCDRVTIMRDGRTVREAEMRDLGKLELVAVMLGREPGQVAAQGQTGFGEKSTTVSAPMLSVEGLSAPPRVMDTTLSVGRGEIVGLAGLLGAGRTETARVVFGADPGSARMTLDDQPYAPKEPRDAIARKVGFVTEDRKVEGIIPDLSVRENLTLALLPLLTRFGVVDARRQATVVETYVRRLGVRLASVDQPIRTLSGGNQQKVLLARWLATDPRLLILDEPTRGIDVGAKAEIQAMIRGLARDGLGVLMISSEVEEIVEGADRAVVMRDGRSVAGLFGETLTEERVLHVMAHGEAG